MTSKEIMTGRCREDELWHREIALQLALMNEMELARRRSQEMIDAVPSGSETAGTFLVTNGQMCTGFNDFVSAVYCFSENVIRAHAEHQDISQWRIRDTIQERHDDSEDGSK